MTSTPRPIQFVSNAELYNRWAKVYDTDGNILQAIDDVLLPPLLEHALSLLSNSTGITITELGCGTGRNTAKLLLPFITSKASIKEINALDLSPSMLEAAKQRCESLLASMALNATSVPLIMNFHVFDALDSANLTDIWFTSKADLVLSTLVLEHLPLGIFFKTVTTILKPNGLLVLTNMHGDMGRVSQAGFLDPETGEKVRGTSYVYEIDEVVKEAEEYGLEVMGDAEERVVREVDIGEGRVLGPRGSKWIGTKVWFGLLMRLRTARTA